MFVLFSIPIVPAIGVDLLVLVWNALEPSPFIGIINAEQYWHSRKVFVVLYEALPQVVMQALIFSGTPVASTWDLTIFILSFIGSASG